MKQPRPSSLRLTTQARRAWAPVPPFGASAWSVEAPALAVLLDPRGVGDVGDVARQIPSADALAPDTPVLVLGTAAQSASPFLRLFRPRVEVPRALRCTALVARGYVEIGADIDRKTGADVAWGWSR